LFEYLYAPYRFFSFLVVVEIILLSLQRSQKSHEEFCRLNFVINKLHYRKQLGLFFQRNLHESVLNYALRKIFEIRDIYHTLIVFNSISSFIRISGI